MAGGKVNISIKVDRPAGPYYPGDVVHATIRLRSEKEMKIQKARAWLLLWEHYWFVARSGRRRARTWDVAQQPVATETLLDEGVIPAGFDQTYHFDWRIPPDAPPPYNGQITRNHWLVKVVIDRKLKKDIRAEVKVPLIVPPPGRQVEPGEHGDAWAWDRADMQLWLPRLEWVKGEVVGGKLLVRPEKDFTAGEVRVELKRLEHTLRDSGDSYTVTEDKAKLARKTKFRAGEAAEYLFDLIIPDQGHPTRETAHSTVTWTIKGILNQRIRSDFRVEQEIYVYNGPAPQE